MSQLEFYLKYQIIAKPSIINPILFSAEEYVMRIINYPKMN
jgi:hypothetical protein